VAAAVVRGEVRDDRFYGVNVLALVLAPLRDRGEDVEVLAEAFTGRLAAQYWMPVPVLGPEVRDAIRAHTWPGNVRELRNAIERALVLSPPGTLELAELPSRRAAEPPRDGTLPFPATIRQITQAASQAMLELVAGNKSEAARRLGISRPRLQRILDGQGDDES